MTAKEPDDVPTRAFAEAMAGSERIVRRATPAEAFGRARELFREGRRLDMAALAADIGVARGTLYRWTGDRDRLLADVAWVEVSAAPQRIEAHTRGRGIKRIGAVTDRFLAEVSRDRALRAFLEAEGASGLRLLTAPGGGVRPRLVDMIATLIETEAQRGDYRPPADPHMLADAIVSLGERFLYHGGDPAMNPDPITARTAITLLLRE
jgi:AcrR family transcriptional regulator